MSEIIKDLRRELFEAVKRGSYRGLLLSGGLDTSVLASLNPKVIGITVGLESEAEDIPYAESLARFLNIEHLQRKVDIDEAIEGIPEVIKILKSFDPAIPNDLAVYFGLKEFKNLRVDKVATGDGADELFGGYSFMEGTDDLGSYIQGISKRMNFSSKILGESFGIKIIQPFCDREVIDLSLKIPAELKIREYDGRVFGKWILRKAFEDVLPKEIIWQNKRPIEYGSGMNRLREIITSRISDEEFKQKSRLYLIRFMNKEHLYYYEIYKKEVGEIFPPKEGQERCPGCTAGIEKGAVHCRVCGYSYSATN